MGNQVDDRVSARWLRSHVERCLQDTWDVAHLLRDAEGDYPFRHGTAACWVCLDTRGQEGQWTVRVLGQALVGIASSPGLLAELNDLNRGARCVSVYSCQDVVMVRQALAARTLDRAGLAQAMVAVGDRAEHVGALLGPAFGGRPPLPLGDPIYDDGQPG